MHTAGAIACISSRHCIQLILDEVTSTPTLQRQPTYGSFEEGSWNFPAPSHQGRKFEMEGVRSSRIYQKFERVHIMTQLFLDTLLDFKLGLQRRLCSKLRSECTGGSLCRVDCQQRPFGSASTLTLPFYYLVRAQQVFIVLSCCRFV